MNTNGLAKLYDKLSIRERLSAIVAAEARRDEAELGRLIDASERKMYSIADAYRPHALLREMAILALAELLEHVAHFNESYWLADAQTHDSRAEVFWDLAQVFAYYIMAKLRGWEDFCATLAVEPYSPALWPEQMTATVRRAAERAAGCAKTADEMRVFLAKREKGAEPITAESAAAGWREAFEELTA